MTVQSAAHGKPSPSLRKPEGREDEGSHAGGHQDWGKLAPARASRKAENDEAPFCGRSG